MDMSIKALIKKGSLLTLAYVLALGSVNIVTPYLFSDKANAFSSQADYLQVSPYDAVAVTQEIGSSTLFSIKATNSDTANSKSVRLGNLAGSITANVDGGKVAYTATDCSVVDWTTVVADASATVTINGHKKAQAKFCYLAPSVGVNYKIDFVGSFPYDWGRNASGVLTPSKAVSVVAVEGAPSIKLNGDATVEIEAGETYTDAGATAYDVQDGDITEDIDTTGAIIDTSNVGDYTVEYTVTDSDGHKVSSSRTVNVVPRKITVTARSLDKFYGEADPAFECDITAGTLIGGGTDLVSCPLGRDDNENAGTYSITEGDLSASLGENYEVNFIGDDFTIKQALLTIQIKDATKVYGTADPAFTYDVVKGEVVEGDVPTGAFERTAGENVGEYDIKQGTFTYGDNYEIIVNDGKLKIDPTQITVAADAISKVVGSEDPTLTYKITAGAVKAGDELKIAISRAVGEKVGLYEINASDQGNPNYIISFIKGIFKIIDKAIEVEVKTPTPVVLNPVAQIATVD